VVATSASRLRLGWASIATIRRYGSQPVKTKKLGATLQAKNNGLIAITERRMLKGCATATNLLVRENTYPNIFLILC
jgi:hypothetical protein